MGLSFALPEKKLVHSRKIVINLAVKLVCPISAHIYLKLIQFDGKKLSCNFHLACSYLVCVFFGKIESKSTAWHSFGINRQALFDTKGKSL